MKNKGFTLIELLAVIIVLAIIMVLTIPNVLGTMDKAKKESLNVYAKKVLNQAQRFTSEKEVLGDVVLEGRYSLEDIGLIDHGIYKGEVYIFPGDTSRYLITITDGTYCILNQNIDGINDINNITKKNSNDSCDKIIISE